MNCVMYFFGPTSKLKGFEILTSAMKELRHCQTSLMKRLCEYNYFRKNFHHRHLTRSQLTEINHYVKSVLIWSFSGPYIPTFGLTTERFSASLCIKSKCGKVRTRKIPNTDTFHAVSHMV